MSTPARDATEGGTASPGSDLHIGPHGLSAHLQVPARARGTVLIVLGREEASPALEAIAEAARTRHMATLQVHLLGQAEPAAGSAPDDVELLAQRIGEALDWLRAQPGEGRCGIGICATATAAAAALRSASTRPAPMAALVSVCGRTELAADRMPLVQAATLFIVGSEDDEMLRMNRRAFSALRCVRRLEIIPRAQHADEEAATRTTVAHLAASWLAQNVGRMHTV